MLVAAAFLIFGRGLQMPPLSGDNLYILDWANRTSAGDIVRSDPDFYPEWRPLAYLTAWAQYRQAGLASVFQYHAVNILLWAAVAWLVRQIVVDVTGSPTAGLFAGLLMLADARGVHSITWIIERQASMACLFGLLAVRPLLVQPPRTVRAGEAVWVALLLLASSLSKEFGLAFAITVACIAALEGRKGALMAAVGAVLVYAVLRVGVAGGAASRVCEEMGFFFSLRTVCFVPISSTAIAQGAYNVGAAALDSFLPGLLSGDGRIAIGWTRLPAAAAWLTLAVIGWRSGSQSVRRLAILLPANAVLNFMLYRDRNHLAGLCVIAITAGVGLAGILRERNEQARMRVAEPLRSLVVACVSLLLAVQAVQTRRVVESIVSHEERADPCASLGDLPSLEPGFVARVKNTYGMPDPDCVNR